MNVPDLAENVQRTAAALTYGGATVSAFGGATMFWGKTPEQWQVLGIISGIAIALLGLVVNAAITIYFKHQELKLKKKALEK